MIMLFVVNLVFFVLFCVMGFVFVVYVQDVVFQNLGGMIVIDIVIDSEEFVVKVECVDLLKYICLLFDILQMIIVIINKSIQQQNLLMLCDVL